MALLIDSLMQKPVERRGEGLSTRNKRPMPGRTRDLLEVFAALGNTCTYGGFRRSVEFNGASPQLVGNIVLGRWLTPEELAAQPAEYKPFEHVRELLLSAEFRATLARRVCDVYGDKRRIFAVAVPGIATRYTQEMWESAYPVFPPDFCDSAFDDRDALAAELGKLLGRVVAGKSICLSIRHVSHAVDVPAAPEVTEGIGWCMHMAPLRAQDLLYLVLRSPESLALSLANSTVARLRADPAPQRAARAAGVPIGKPPAPNDERGWRDVALRLVREVLPRNPVCAALGDGSAAAAFASCARLPMHLVALEHYTDWCRTNFEMPPLDPPERGPRVISAADLGAPERAALEARMGEDARFYARFAAVQQASGLPGIASRKLAA